MKKTIVAVMVAASAVLSAQAMATNTAQVTVLGEVSDAANSCVVTPTGTLKQRYRTADHCYHHRSER